MKTTLVVLCFFCATAAFGQAASSGTTALSSEPVVIQFNGHPAHASYQTMGQEQNLLHQSGNVQAHGVRPLWEVAIPSHVVPLGDSARMLRKEHAGAKKADIVWNN
jgi:mRNA degradation ribonuclease J1/J2